MSIKYFIDTEFVERGPDYPIDLISIGIVSSDGRELYAQSVEFDHRKASEWVKDNVLVHLQSCLWANVTHVNPQHSYVNELNYHKGHGQCVDQQRGRIHNCPWRTREQLKRNVLSFMDIEAYGEPELWGWITGYDYVTFCQIFGTMMDLPPGYPHYIKDLQHVLDERGISDDELPEQEEGLHNALHDARHLKRLWGYIVRNDCWQ